MRVLLNDCVVLDKKFETLREKTLLLIPYYIETRYPGFDDFGSFSKQNAKEAYEAAKEIITFIQKRIG